MGKPREIYLTISFIRNLKNPGYYIELYGTDEAGIEVRSEDRADEKANTLAHEFFHFIIEHFLPNLPSKRKNILLTEKEENNLCEKVGEFVELLLRPYLKKYYRNSSLGTQKK